jgi:hypothetical protein
MDEKYLDRGLFVDAIEEKSGTESWHALLHRRQYLSREEPNVIQVVKVENLKIDA